MSCPKTSFHLHTYLSLLIAEQGSCEFQVLLDNSFGLIKKTNQILSGFSPESGRSDNAMLKAFMGWHIIELTNHAMQRSFDRCHLTL